MNYDLFALTVRGHLYGQLTMTELLLFLTSLKLAPYLYNPRRAPLISVLPVVDVKESRQLRMSLRESTFSVNSSRLTWRVLVFDRNNLLTTSLIFTLFPTREGDKDFISLTRGTLSTSYLYIYIIYIVYINTYIYL